MIVILPCRSMNVRRWDVVLLIQKLFELPVNGLAPDEITDLIGLDFCFDVGSFENLYPLRRGNRFTSGFESRYAFVNALADIFLYSLNRASGELNPF